MPQHVPLLFVTPPVAAPLATWEAVEPVAPRFDLADGTYSIFLCVRAEDTSRPQLLLEVSDVARRKQLLVHLGRGGERLAAVHRDLVTGACQRVSARIPVCDHALVEVHRLGGFFPELSLRCGDAYAPEGDAPATTRPVGPPPVANCRGQYHLGPAVTAMALRSPGLEAAACAQLRRRLCRAESQRGFSQDRVERSTVA